MIEKQKKRKVSPSIYILLVIMKLLVPKSQGVVKINFNNICEVSKTMHCNLLINLNLYVIVYSISHV